MSDQPDTTLPRRSREVLEALRAAGVDAQIVELPDATPTARGAAAAVGCEIGAIASSIVFSCGGEPLLVMTSGRHRVDTEHLERELGLPPGAIERATPEQVRTWTGQAIGGVAPVGHPRRLRTIVDRALGEHAELWAAGGTPSTVVALTYGELLAITSGEEHTVAGGAA